MNFRKGSKWPLTPALHPSELPLSLEIMCMHFMLSGPRTSLHIFDHIQCKRFATLFSENEGGSKGVWNFSEKFITFGSAIRPLPEGSFEWREMNQIPCLDLQNSPGPRRPLMKFHFQDVKAYQQITEDLDVIYVYKSCLPNDTQISAIL